MKLSTNVKLKLLVLMNHILLIIFLFTFEFNITVLLSIISILLIVKLGVEVGFHRMISHKQIVPTRTLKFVLTYLGCMAGIGSPASYALIHRTHHAYSDTENDPHCPTHIGVLRTWFTFWNTTKCRPSFIKDISSDKIYKFFHKNYFIVYFSTLLLFMLFGLSVAVIFISIPCVYAFHMYGSVNTLGHLPGLHGYKNFKEISGTNSRILNLLSFGEHLHNNHHNNPRLCNSTRPSEIDVSKYIISILVYLGVCTYTV